MISIKKERKSMVMGWVYATCVQEREREREREGGLKNKKTKSGSKVYY